MNESWPVRIARAEQLAEEVGAAADLLRFYARLLQGQHQCAVALAQGALTGVLDRDLPRLREAASAIFRIVAGEGPASLVDQARQLMRGGASALERSLADCWSSPSGDRFFAKAVLQPYAATLASRRVAPTGWPAVSGATACPFCGGRPQLAVLDLPDGRGEGGGRSLLCATCLTSWPVPRMCCAHCGETREGRLGYFHSPAFDHVFVEVCEACRNYQKRIDRSRLGVAVPIVDELAAAPLDLWAREQGYRKIELNLIGL